MATVTVGYDTTGAQGDYATLALWWAAVVARSSGGVVTEAETARLMNGTNAGRGPGSMTPFVTTATFPPSAISGTSSFPIIIEPAPGYGIADNITAGTGPLRIDTTKGAAITTTTGYIRLLDDVGNYMTIRGLQLVCTDTTSKLNGTGSENVTWEQNLIRVAGTGSNIMVTIGVNSIFRRNVLVLDGTGGDGLYMPASGGKAQRNTIVRTSNRTAANTAITLASPTNTDVRGNAIFGFTTAFTGSTPASAGNNATDAASLDGAAATGSLTSQTYSNIFENNGSAGATTSDWRLKTGSPLIDAGTAISGITTDILGTSIPQGSAADIGAFEVVSAGDVTAPVLTSPVGTATGQTTATIGATTDEGNGTLYGVVTTSATPPTATQIKAGQNNGGTAAVFAGTTSVGSTGAKTISATGLTASTGYYAHLVHTDSANNNSNVVSSSLFTTSPATLVAGTASFSSSGPTTITVTSTNATGGSTPYTYQWQRNADGGSYSNISNGGGVSGATTLTLTDGSVSAGVLYGYKLVFTDNAAVSVTSNSITAMRYSGGSLTAGGNTYSRGRIVNGC